MEYDSSAVLGGISGRYSGSGLSSIFHHRGIRSICKTVALYHRIRCRCPCCSGDVSCENMGRGRWKIHFCFFYLKYFKTWRLSEIFHVRQIFQKDRRWKESWTGKRFLYVPAFLVLRMGWRYQRSMELAYWKQPLSFRIPASICCMGIV